MEECPSWEHYLGQRRSLDDEHSTSKEHCGGLIMNLPLSRRTLGTKGLQKA